MPKYILMIGCLSEGWKAYGPFDTFDEASQFDEQSYEGFISPPSWIMEITDPTAFKSSIASGLTATK